MLCYLISGLEQVTTDHAHYGHPVTAPDGWKKQKWPLIEFLNVSNDVVLMDKLPVSGRLLFGRRRCSSGALNSAAA
jgi:hypothetical protein